ncbi:hypothetical protein PG993_004230 [Apiospora rasikravindrae]|uniref:Uncharacterized protein n=1 Tax=Apiospora rasikravindrae TaxID=990691 RepID=A0ABR1TC55_9PEZI
MSRPAPKPEAWLYSGSSTGRYLGSLRVSVRRLDYWEAVGLAREEFTEVIQPNLISYLRENSAEISTSTCMLNLSLFMMGRSPLKTKPTIMFVSEDKKVRKEALNLAKKSDVLLEYPGFALGECRLIAEFAGQRQIGDYSDKPTSQPGGKTEQVELFTDSTSSSVGSRVCARSKARPDRFATIGGLLIYRGTTLGLTVGHILHSESTTDVIEPDKSDDECEVIGLDYSDEDSDDEEGLIEFVDSTSLASGSPGALSDAASVSTFDTDEDAASSLSSRAHAEGAIGPVLDQSRAPAMNIGSEFTSQAGDIMFSSQALDYCVFSMEISSHSQQPRPNTRIDLEDLDASLEHRPRETQVSVFTKRAGDIRGAMKAHSSYCRFPSATNFQEVFTAKLDRPLVAGDCGSWVFDTQTGKLFGHVVAASMGNTVITIMPASDVFRSILAQLTPKLTEKPQQHGGMQPAVRTAHHSMRIDGHSPQPQARPRARLSGQVNLRRGAQNLGLINRRKGMTAADEKWVRNATASNDVFENVQVTNNPQRIGQIVFPDARPMPIAGDYHHNRNEGEGDQDVGLVLL